MANVILNDEQVRVNETSKGKIYSKNYRSLTQELRAKGTDVTLNTEKHSFFINGNAYYVGPSMASIKTLADVRANAKDIQFCDSSIDGGKSWVPCMMLVKNNGEHGDFSDLI